MGKESDLIKELLKIIDLLLGPEGCPWDRKQTLLSMRASLMEEAGELVEAIDSGEKNNIVEEIGDLFFVVLFLARLAEKEGKGSVNEALQSINEKLIRRHPHIFGEEKKQLTEEEVLRQWQQIKAQEKIRNLDEQ